MSFGMLAHNAFAMGAAPASCNNLYSGTITSFIINNGSQTFDAIANPGVAFNVNDGKSYSTTFVIHTANESNSNNTNPGETWYETDAPAFWWGACVGNTGPDQNATAFESWIEPPTYPTNQEFTQGVLFQSYGGNTVGYTVHWMPSQTSSSSTTAPSQPQNLMATAGNSLVSLSWTAPSSNGGSAITGYKVYKSTSSGTENLLTTIGNVTSYNDTTVTNGQAYFYKVSSVNSVGESSQSNEANATPTAPVTGIRLNSIQTTSGTVSSSPYQLTLSNFNAGTSSNNLLVVGVSANNNVVASVTFGGVHLSKKASSFSNNDAEFWYLVNPSGTGNIVVTMAGSTSAVVGAYSFSGVDQTTPIPTSTTNHNTAASSPTISITTKNQNSWVLDLPAIYGGVTLGSQTCTQQWDSNIPSAITGASSSAMVQSPGSVTCGWTASGGGDMWDDIAVEVKASATGSGGTTTIPSSPTGLTVNAISSSQINLSWTAPANNGGSAITGYKIERSTDGITFTTIQSNTASTTTTYSDTGLVASTTYTYRVSAINAVGTSSPSNTASATTGSAPPTTTQVTISVKSVNLSGNPIAGMSVVIRYTNGTTISDTFTPASFTVTSGTTYVVHVRNYGTNVFSHWQDGTTNSYYTITPTQNVTLTAYYSTS